MLYDEPVTRYSVRKTGAAEKLTTWRQTGVWLMMQDIITNHTPVGLQVVTFSVVPVLHMLYLVTGSSYNIAVHFSEFGKIGTK